MTPVSKYYGDNRYATVENITNGYYVVSLFTEGKQIEKQSFTRLKDAEDVAENFVMGETPVTTSLESKFIFPEDC